MDEHAKYCILQRNELADSGRFLRYAAHGSLPMNASLTEELQEFITRLDEKIDGDSAEPWHQIKSDIRRFVSRPDIFALQRQILETSGLQFSSEVQKEEARLLKAIFAKMDEFDSKVFLAY